MNLQHTTLKSVRYLPSIRERGHIRLLMFGALTRTVKQVLSRYSKSSLGQSGAGIDEETVMHSPCL